MFPLAAALLSVASPVDWFAEIEIPNSETRLAELATTNGFGAFSREWIGAALSTTPPLEAWLDEARERTKPVLWYVPAIEGSHVILPHLLDRFVMQGVLSDPRVSELLDRRFVAVKAPAGGELVERFGLKAPAFIEPGFLVLSPEGEVLARMDRFYAFQPEALYEPLVKLLDGSGFRSSEEYRRCRAAWTARRGEEAGLAFARQAALDGDLATAASVLRELDANAPRVLLASAELSVLLRDAHGARRSLTRLREETVDPELLHEANATEGFLAMRQGELEEAENLLRASLDHGGARAAESGYHLGAVLWATRREADARLAWRSVASEHVGSAWAARADANACVGSDGLPGDGPLPRSMEDVVWAQPVTFERGTADPHPTGDLDAIVRRAVDFLLRQQRSDGAWLGSRWGGSGGPRPEEPVALGPGLFSNIHTAISALACAALHAWRDVRPEAIDSALLLAEPYLLRDDLVFRGEGSTMWVYSDAFRLLHFARSRASSEPLPDEIRAAMQAWVDALVGHQAETGTFLHYPYESTFVPAMVSLCLDEARRVGIPVEPEVFDRTADMLEEARGGDHALFGYLAEYPEVNRSLAGAACRQPLCTLALLRCGRVGLDEVEAGIELFLDNYADYVEPPRKCNFHMPELDGSAGYFFFHNMLATCMAAAASGERRFVVRLRELLCELPEVDGAFLDSGFSYGKSYGTAAALLALAVLRDA